MPHVEGAIRETVGSRIRNQTDEMVKPTSASARTFSLVDIISLHITGLGNT